MTISSFDDLLLAAGLQTQPQRLLFVFAGAALPDDCTPEQREAFLRGDGGELVPLMYVDKLPQELQNFAALEQESQAFGKEWSLVFAAAMSGRDGAAPTSEEAEQHLQDMVEKIKVGSFETFIPFNRQGDTVNFN